jgi:hypothetical protein
LLKVRDQEWHPKLIGRTSARFFANEHIFISELFDQYRGHETPEIDHNKSFSLGQQATGFTGTSDLPLNAKRR